jgi:apolipoprotein N-acyltransferase
MRLTEQTKRAGADFVVWSETSAMRPMLEATYKQDAQAMVAARLGVPAIFGAVLVRPDPNPDREYVWYNTGLSSDARGRINGRYDKEYLLTFGEYLPFGDTFPILYKWSPHSGKFSPGTALDPLTIELKGTKHPVTTLICYEDILPAFTNKAAGQASPELLVNMTNDAWFGDTLEPWQHLALAQIRAVEHRRYLVRGTNSGVSAIVDPIGRVVAQTSTFQEEAITGTIRWMRASTVYEAVGDWPWWLVSVLAFAGAFRFRNKPASVKPSESPASSAANS